MVEAATPPIVYYIFQWNRNITVALVKNPDDRTKALKMYENTKKLLHCSEIYPCPETGLIHVSITAPNQRDVEIPKTDWEVSVSRIYELKSENFLVKGSSNEATLKFQINEEEQDFFVKFTELAKSRSAPEGMHDGDYVASAKKRRMDGTDASTSMDSKVSRQGGLYYDVHVEGNIRNLRIGSENSTRSSEESENEDHGEGTSSSNPRTSPKTTY